MKKALLLLIIVSAFTAGCEKEIPFDERDARTRIVLYSFLVPGDQIEVSLTESQSILVNSWVDEHPPVEGANIKVYKNGVLLGTMTEVSTPDETIYTLAQEIVEAGATYRFEVEHSKLEGVESFTRVPAEAPAFSAAVVDSSLYEWTLEVEVSPMSGKQHYILDLIWEYDDFNVSYEPIWFNSTDPFLSTPYTYYDPTDPNKYFDGEAYFTDDHFEDAPYKFRVKFYVGEWAQENYEGLHVRIKNVSEDYYLFKYSSLLQQWTDGDPFAQPAVVHNNVENGIGCVGSMNPGTVVIDF